MRICIPTETNEGINAKVYAHFGSAPYFTIYDTKLNKVEVVSNDNMNHTHGMCQPMNVLANKNINAVLCSGMGTRAIQKLNESGIKVYKIIPGKVSDIVEQFINGDIEEITVEDACGQHNCQ